MGSAVWVSIRCSSISRRPISGGIDDFDTWLTTAQERAAGSRKCSATRRAARSSVWRTTCAPILPMASSRSASVAHGAAMARSPLSTEVHYLMATHVLEDLGYRRYEWKCNSENEPSRTTALASASVLKAFSASI